MNWLLLSRMLGLLSLLVGGAMLFSLPWAFPLFGQVEQFEEAGFWGLFLSMFISLLGGCILWAFGRGQSGTILRKEAFAVVGCGWFWAGVLGSLPYVLSGTQRADGVPMTFADAFFESVSGFTTTGASVLSELQDPALVPRCVLFWRSFTHWLGGMGIVVLFVAILGQLGVGGKALMRREVPGPINETVRPRVQETATVMWSIYMALSAVLTLLLWLEGLTVYDALCHSFGTMATGGFSTFNASVGHFSSAEFNGPMIGGYSVVELTILIFMFLAGVNFTLYFLVVKNLGPVRPRKDSRWNIFRPVWTDPEFRAYCGILLGIAVLLTVSLTRNGEYGVVESARHSAFMAVTITTTTGFGTEDFVQWPEFAKGLLLALMFVGGCAGSTGGGTKVIRIVLYAKIVWTQLERAYRPNIVRPVRMGGVPIDDDVRADVTAYISLVAGIVIASWLVLITIEPDVAWAGQEPAKLLDSLSAVITCLNNVGPGLGIFGPKSNFGALTDSGKLICSVLMLLGRLEIYAVLVLFLPSFWRRG